MENLDIVERLRGKVRVPVNDGAGLLNGLDYFERTFPTSKAAMEAADEIERLRAVLTGIAEYCSGEDRTLGAIKRLVAIRNTAEQAVRQIR